MDWKRPGPNRRLPAMALIFRPAAGTTLPAGFAGLPSGTSIIILVPPALATMTSAATGTVPAPPTSAFRFGPCFIYRQGASLKIFPVEGCDGFGCVLVLGHLDKAKPARFSSVAVSHDFYLLDFPELREKGSKRIFR